MKTRKPQNFDQLIHECHTFVYHIKSGTIISAGFSSSGINSAKNFLKFLLLYMQHYQYFIQ